MYKRQGLISGKVQLFDYGAMFHNQSTQPDESRTSGKAYRRVWSVRPSHKSCRGVAFDASGSNLFCIFKDKSIIALDPSDGHVKARWPRAHEYVRCVFIHALTPTQVCAIPHSAYP